MGDPAGFGKSPSPVYFVFTISVQHRPVLFGFGEMTDLLQLAWFWVLLATMIATPLLMVSGLLN